MKKIGLAVALVLLAWDEAGADRAAAEKLAAQAEAAHAAGELDKSLELFAQAIEADPEWPEAFGMRGQVFARRKEWAAAVEDYSRCVELDAKRTPPDPTTVRDVKWLRALAYMRLERLEEAQDDLEWVLQFEPGYRAARRNYAEALIQAGELDRAWEELGKADPADPMVGTARLLILSMKADWAGVEKHAPPPTGNERDSVVELFRIAALVEQSRLKEAEERAQANWKREASNHSAMSLLGVRVTPGAPGYDPQGAIAWYRQVAEGMPMDHTSLEYEGRALVLAGRYREAAETLSTRGAWRSFELLFWLGAAQWKLDLTAEARETFREARRRNPWLKAHASRVPGLAEFLGPIDKEIAADAGPAKGPRRSGREETTRALSASEVEAWARRFAFARAATEYRKLAETLTSPLRKAEIADRAKDLDGMAALLKRVVDAANAAKPPLKVALAGQSLEITRADAETFEYRIAAGTGKQSWAALDAREFASLAAAQKPPAAEQFALGVLLWDAGAVADAWKALDAAARAAPDLRPRLTTLIARRRGIEPPAGGFVFFRGGWVTPDERAKLEKGMVRCEGEWVTAADAEKLGRGLKKAGDKWVTPEDAELLARGYRKEGGRWLSPAEYDEFHSRWENAWVVETTHYTIRTTQSEAFARDLGAVVELAYGEFRKYWGGREAKLDKGEKMVLLAYRSFEDYRLHCVQKKAQDAINAAGFAQADSKTVAGWNKLNDLRTFLQTMVHEAAHLYYWRAVGWSDPPSWLAEGMATYFEGFEWTGKEWKYTWLAPDRQHFARDAVLKGTHFPIAEFTRGDAGKLINENPGRAIVFYAQAWSLNMYLTTTSKIAYRKAYEAYRKDAERGKTDALSKYFPDLKQLESDWKKFVVGK